MREKLIMDFEWLFHRGDIDTSVIPDKANTYKYSKAERGRGPAGVKFDDSAWEKIELPHDYVVLQYPEQQYNNAQGYFLYEKAWYRRHFKLEPGDENRRLVLKFDGVAKYCTIWVNGRLLKRNFCGYTSFEVDITDAVLFDGLDNVVAVQTDPTDVEGWWYEGGGLYRHVWLVKTDFLSISDVWICPEYKGSNRKGWFKSGENINQENVSKENVNKENANQENENKKNIRQEDVNRENVNKWIVKTEIILHNASYFARKAQICLRLLLKNGEEIAAAVSKEIAAAVSKKIVVPLRDKVKISLSLNVDNPALWGIESPNLYTVETILLSDGVTIDNIETRTGFRTIDFDANEGFFLNGKNVKILGTCSHQCFGPLGNALPDRAHRYKIKLLKEMGSNAYRCAHNPPAEELLDACDEIGMLIMDENRWFESSEENMEQLAGMVIRDRNHPSIIMWSVGNEEPLQKKPAGRRIMEALRAHVRRYDKSRPVTLALNGGMLDRQASEVSDIIGINYHLDTYDALHELHPDRPLVASECVACPSTRGHYAPMDITKGYFTAYDINYYSFGSNRRDTWKAVDSHPFIMGLFIWAGVEHRGETDWPRLFSQSGSLDMAWFKKDAFYMNKAQWDKKPMVHLFPHWNRECGEDKLVEVCTYTNAAEVELYLNGKSLGREKVENYDFPSWQVKYEPGVLKAVAYNRNPAGEDVVVATDIKETTGKAVALKLTLDDNVPTIAANGRDAAIITCSCIDAEGRMVPDASPMVEFTCNGLGRIWGTASDVSDHEPVYLPVRRMRAGLIRVVVRTGFEAGTLTVTAKADADALESVFIDIPII